MGPDVHLLRGPVPRRLARALLLGAACGAAGAGGPPGVLEGQEIIEQPRARVGRIAPEFALPDLMGRRRLSEDVFGTTATALVFLDGRDRDRARVGVTVLERLRRAHECDGFAIVVVDVSPVWMEPDALAELYRTVRGAVVLRDAAGELESIYRSREPPIAFLLDARHDVRYAGSLGGLDPRGEADRIRMLLPDSADPCAPSARPPTPP